MGFIKNCLALYGLNELMKKEKKNRSNNERNLWRKEMARQDEYERDCYCYGEDEAF